MSNEGNTLDLSDLRDPDGYYRDGIAALRLMIEEINASNLADDLTLALPAGAVSVELNGGVPVYLVKADDDFFEQATFSEIVDYLEGAHHPKVGVPIDPRLPTDFDDTPNDARPASHQIWWNRPFILTDEWSGKEPWEQYRDRLSGMDFEPDFTPEEWEEFQNDRERQWFANWPTGTRYDVRCLDGGAWDRSTWWGSFATLEQAQECAGKGRDWGWKHAR